MYGHVKWFNRVRGFGFIEADDKTEVFVHYSGIQGDGYRNLYEEQPVKFDLVDDGKGPKAINVQVRKLPA